VTWFYIFNTPEIDMENGQFMLNLLEEVLPRE